MATINKEYKTINERIGILQSRGLLFKNVSTHLITPRKFQVL